MGVGHFIRIGIRQCECTVMQVKKQTSFEVKTTCQGKTKFSPGQGIVREF